MSVTYVADVDGLARLTARAGVICERVGGVGCSHAGIEPTGSGDSGSNKSRSTAESAAATEASCKATASAKATAGTKASSKTAASAEASSEAATARCSAGEAILTDLKVASLPVIAIKLLNGVARILGRLEGDNSRALGASIRGDVNIGAKNRASMC